MGRNNFWGKLLRVNNMNWICKVRGLLYCMFQDTYGYWGLLEPGNWWAVFEWFSFKVAPGQSILFRPNILVENKFVFLQCAIGGFSSNPQSWEIFEPRCGVKVQMYWMETESAVLVSSGPVQNMAMVSGRPSNLSFTSCRNVAAGVLALSRLIVVWMDRLWWYEISKFLSLNFLAVQNATL